MFENAPPKPIGKELRFAADRRRESEPRAGRAVPQTESGENSGSALRMVEWGELSARLKAARDLRVLLSRDSDGNIEAAGGGFADAAARYFREREECQQDVNPVALEQGKGSSGKKPEHEAPLNPALEDRDFAATGDARED